MSAYPPALSAAFGGEQDRLLNEHEAAALLGYTPRALQNWRLRGGGPMFVKVSERSIRYRQRDLSAWIEAKLRVSSADPGPRTSVACAALAPLVNTR